MKSRFYLERRILWKKKLLGIGLILMMAFGLTACGSSNVINICEYAKEVCGCDKIVSIIGGLHLLRASEDRIMKIIE